MPALPDAAIDVWVEHCLEPSSPFTQVVLEPRGGACARVDEDATPLRRDAAFNAAVFTQWDDPAETDRHVAWTRDMAAALEPHTISGAVLNYTSDTGEDRVRATFGAAKYARLAAAEAAVGSGQRVPAEPEHPAVSGPGYGSWSTDSTLPAGSLNQAICGPASRATPFSSWPNPS